ncbi:PREDICTED: uncharacterized protein LOC104826573 isoform X2 [Tarenaya hassleriana]|uniref:uncharacterized protein LOC104826573 isoform X2 n=1 Tax=Tarenaya hassleriana TaxID=28532 RepID=UPI00053C6438|nr:PREDICTED: uncharacterized protein LOC104826573 isoform X2 [Tarenaya hassleriana]
MGSRVYVHYNHTDSCNYARWTARESFRFMYDRPWQHILDFYSNVVKGSVSVPELFGTKKSVVHHDEGKAERSHSEDELENSTGIKEKGGRWARVTFKIVLSYSGSSFDGWQKQPGLHTVQGVVEKSLGGFLDERKAQLLKDKCKPLEGNVVVAGRTDKGVSALNQVCSFNTWRKDVNPNDLEYAINKEAPGKLRVVSVCKVSRTFHPNFSAKWRRYLYIFPLDDGKGTEQLCESDKGPESFVSNKRYSKQRNGLISEENVGVITREDNGEIKVEEASEENELEAKEKPRDFSVHKVDQLLRQLEGKLLSYKMFARDTKAARNEGPPTECFMYHARAAEVRFPCSMVRVLVATSIREAAAGAEDDALLRLMDASCRRATAPPAPPDGLCLFDVGYTDFDPQHSLIP